MVNKKVIEQALFALEELILEYKNAWAQTNDQALQSEIRSDIDTVQGWYDELRDMTGHTWGE